ncbi:MAG: HAD family hydrolase [Myxococcales bacterium]|jgi:HAD superfamily hydrolase (TIGR01509 family)
MSRVLVFDMGGVLYDFQGDRVIAEHSRRPRRWRSEEVQERWPGLAHAFETGTCGETIFAEAIVQHYDLRLGSAEFLLAFRAAAVGFHDGALELLSELRGRHPLVSLSNTNAVQWPKLLEDLGASDPFQAHHPSHRSGFHKPDRRAFTSLANSLPAGSECYFFDDRAQNVRAAAELGWQARRVRGVAEARRACLELGLLE